jgi:hypothetical protein
LVDEKQLKKIYNIGLALNTYVLIAIQESQERQTLYQLDWDLHKGSRSIAIAYSLLPNNDDPT